MPPHFHPLETDIKKPAKFTDPFCYEPHPLCLLAAKEVQGYIAGDGRLCADADRGKMFGVLVVGTGDGQLGYLAAFSGLLCGTNDWPFFVPPVFDAMRPDGYFKTREAVITALNHDIDDILDATIEEPEEADDDINYEADEEEPLAIKPLRLFTHPLTDIPEPSSDIEVTYKVLTGEHCGT